MPSAPMVDLGQTARWRRAPPRPRLGTRWTGAERRPRQESSRQPATRLRKKIAPSTSARPPTQARARPASLASSSLSEPERFGSLKDDGVRITAADSFQAAGPPLGGQLPIHRLRYRGRSRGRLGGGQRRDWGSGGDRAPGLRDVSGWVGLDAGHSLEPTQSRLEACDPLREGSSAFGRVSVHRLRFLSLEHCTGANPIASRTQRVIRRAIPAPPTSLPWPADADRGNPLHVYANTLSRWHGRPE